MAAVASGPRAPEAPYLTVNDVAAALDVPIHRVTYAIKTRRIEPAQRAGIIRLFAREQVPLIAAALRHVEGRRQPFTGPDQD